MAKALNKSMDRVLWMNRRAKGKSGSQRTRSRKSNLLLFVLVTLFAVMCSLFFVWSRIQVIQLGYEISSALKEGRSLLEDNNKLRVEIATLKSYTRIERFAKEELGMSKPRPDQVIVIK